ncbi:MAG: 3-phosphoshikimate 1-carboxyvinyltransferase [Dehalococcoidia bacterium]|nr:3-phosphoshikimate 1-carboxyvinyltransferase [Dehalococcoidia bacterium]
MKISISKSIAKGLLDAPSSKSYTIRALMCAALAPGHSYIRRALFADDTLAAADVLQKTGIGILKNEHGWGIEGGLLKTPSSELFCRDSAATLRFMTAISALIPGTVRLVPGAGLAKRPVLPLLDALTQLGVNCRLEDQTILVEDSEFHGGRVEMPGDISSQFISALLIAGARSQQGVQIALTSPPVSKPYLNMTIECLKKFGIHAAASPTMEEFRVARQDFRPVEYTVEGDWSQASYLLALGTLCGEVIVSNLNAESLQGDRVILTLLTRMGARLSVRRSSVMAQRSFLHGINADLSDCIDLLPTMAVLAACADGESRFSGVKNARLKESNRVEAVAAELRKTGIRVRDEDDVLVIFGGSPRGAVIDSHDDHRMAMAFGVLGAAAGDMTIEGAECVAKTYPDFWKSLTTLGIKVENDVKQSG